VGGVRIDQHTVHGLVIELAMMVSVDGHLGMFQGLVNYLGSARAHHMGIVHRSDVAEELADITYQISDLLSVGY